MRKLFFILFLFCSIGSFGQGLKALLISGTAKDSICIYLENSGLITANSNTLSVPYFSTLNNNEVLVLYVGFEGDATTITTPTGWTHLTEDQSDANMSQAVFRKISDGTETGNISLSFGNTGNCAAILVRFSEVSSSYSSSHTGPNPTIYNTGGTDGGDSGGNKYLTTILAALILNSHTEAAMSGLDFKVDLTTTSNGGWSFILSTFEARDGETRPESTYTVATSDEYYLFFRLQYKYWEL